MKSVSQRPLQRPAPAPSRPSAMEMSSPPGMVVPSLGPWSKFFPAAGSQSDSDSTLRNSSSCTSSGSCTEDTVSDGTDFMALVSGLPQQFHKAYQGLAPIVAYSGAELMELVSCSPFTNKRHRPYPRFPSLNFAPYRTFQI